MLPPYLPPIVHGDVGTLGERLNFRVWSNIFSTSRKKVLHGCLCRRYIRPALASLSLKLKQATLRTNITHSLTFF